MLESHSYEKKIDIRVPFREGNFWEMGRGTNVGTGVGSGETSSERKNTKAFTKTSTQNLSYL